MNDLAVLKQFLNLDEDEQASLAAGVPFVRVTDTNIEVAWKEVAVLVERATHEVEDPLARLFGA